MIKTKSRILLKVIAMIMIMMVTVSFIPTDKSIVKAGSTLEELQDKINQLEQQIKDTDKKLSSNKNNIDNAKSQETLLSQKRSLIRDQLDFYNQKIVTINEQITSKNKEITAKEKEIAVKEKEIKETEEAFSKRIGAIYKANKSNSTLKALLSSENFSDFLRNAEMLKRVSESDNKLLEDLRTQKKELDGEMAELAKQKEELSKQKASLTSTQQSYSSKENQLSAMYNENSQNLSDYEKQQKDYLANKAKYQAESDRLEREVERIMAENQDKGQGEGTGIMMWPVPSTHRITTEFGVTYSPWGTYVKTHYGLDISKGPSARGDTVVAADSGEVVTVVTGQKEYNTSGGYGNHIIIRHGNNLSTLYGHLTTVEVKVGQVVTKGQRIGGMGTTGNSTGVHLHFGVMKGSTWVNPHTYVGY